MILEWYTQKAFSKYFCKTFKVAVLRCGLVMWGEKKHQPAQICEKVKTNDIVKSYNPCSVQENLLLFVWVNKTNDWTEFFYWQSRKLDI